MIVVASIPGLPHALQDDSQVYRTPQNQQWSEFTVGFGGTHYVPRVLWFMLRFFELMCLDDSQDLTRTASDNSRRVALSAQIQLVAKVL